jgi:hypothetical protein
MPDKLNELRESLAECQHGNDKLRESARLHRQRADKLVGEVEALKQQLKAAGRMAAALQAYYEGDGVEICMTCRHEKYYPDSSGVSFSGGWQCEPDWWVRECQHPDPEARTQVDEIYDEMSPDGGTKYGVHSPPVIGCQWWEAGGDDAEAERLLESLTPGGSEFAGDPQACAEWARRRLTSVGKLALERNTFRAAALSRAQERNRYRQTLGNILSTLDSFRDRGDDAVVDLVRDIVKEGLEATDE